MAISYRKQYGSEAEFMYDLAKTTGKFDEKAYDSLLSTGQAEDYAYAVAGTKNKISASFVKEDYDILKPKDKLTYILNEYYVDKNSEEYVKNKEYLDYRTQEAIDEKTFNSLNDFERAMATIGGVIGNTMNELFLGTLEGLIDSFGTVVGAKDFVAQDITGVSANREALQRFSRAYTYIDKSKPVQIINDVVTGLFKMAPLAIPYAGSAIYFGGMAGNTAEAAVIANPDIDYFSLIGYTAAVTGVEFAVEKISGIFGGSAIDNLMFKTASSKTGSWIARIGMDFLSEGFEEAISEFADSVLYTVMVDNNAPISSVQDILYAGLIGGLIGGISAGRQIATVRGQTVLSDGTIIDTKKAKELGLVGKKLGKAQSLNLTQSIQNAKNLLDTSAVADLQAKYKTESLQQIQTNHAEEYNNAVAKDTKIQDKLAEATLGLSKIMEMAGVEGFQRASDLANYTISKQAQLLQNYINTITGATAQNRAVESKYRQKFPDSSFTVVDDLTTTEQRLKTAIKNMYDIDVFFGNIGEKNGITKRNGLTLDEKTIVLDHSLSNTMSTESIIETVVKEELVHTLQYESGILTAETINDLMQQYELAGGVSQGAKLSRAYEKDSALTKISESQAKALAQVLLFDKLTVSRVFLTNNSTFNKVYNWMNKWKTRIEALKNRKTNKNKVEYRELLTSMQMYRDIVGETIGNDEDANAAAKEMGLTDEQLQKLYDTYIGDGTTEHYTLLTQNYTYDTERRMRAERVLSDNRKGINKHIPGLSYRNIFNQEYYSEEFVAQIMARNSDKDFRYNLQEFMISEYGFAINEVDQCLMEIIDYNTVTTKEFDADVSDLNANPAAMNKYTKLSQIFNDKFVSKFNTSDGTNHLDDINLIIVPRDSGTTTVAEYRRSDLSIVVYINESTPFTPAQIDVFKHNIFHEITHALSDIQGLQNGTSTNYVKSALIEMNDIRLIQRLGKMLLTEEFYEANKTNKNALIDNIAYGIYRITDGEYAAEAYKTSATRKHDYDVNLKAGATMNRSGFRTDGLVLYGYGRFAGIELQAETIVRTKKAYNIQNLRNATEVVSYNKGNELLDDFAKKGITDFEKAGFSDDFVALLEADKLTENAIWDMINTDSVGTREATDLLIQWLVPENKSIKSLNDIERAKSQGIVYAIVYNKIRLKHDPNYNVKARHTIEQMEKVLNRNPKYMEQVAKEMERLEYLLDNPENSTINSWLLKKDYGYSKNSTDKLLTSLKGYGLSSVRATVSDTVSVRRKGDTDKVSLFDTIADTSLGPEESLIAKTETTETVSDKKTSVESYIETVKASVEKVGDTSKVFKIRKKIENDKKLLIKEYGEDGYSKILEVAPKAKATYTKQIKRLVDKLNKLELTTKEQAILNTDTSDFSPSEYEKYISRLSEISQKSVKKPVTQTSSEETKIAQRADFSQQKTEKLVKNAPIVSATVAPYLFNPIDSKSFEDAKKKVDKQFRETANEVATSLGLTLDTVDTNIGGYTMDDTQPEYAGKIVDEISYTFNFKTDDIYKVDMFSMIMGDIAYENQQAVISSNYVPADATNADGLEHAIIVKETEGVFETIKELGISDYTFDLDTKTIKILEFEWSDRDLIMSNLLNLQEKLGDNVYDITESKIQSRYLDRETRQRTYETWIKDGKISYEDGNVHNLTNQEINLLKQGYDELINTITPKAEQSISQTLLNRFKDSKTDLSEMQFTEAEKEYTKVSYDIIDNEAALFTTITDDNYDQVRKELAESKEPYAPQALVVFDLYTLEMKGRFNKNTQEKIEKVNRETTTVSAQKLALQSKRVKERKPITTTINALKTEGVVVKVDDALLQEYDDKLKDKDKYIKELSDKITELETQIKNTPNILEQQEIQRELKEVSDKKLILENGTNEDIADWIITHAETLEQATKIQEEMLNKMLNKAELADAEDKTVGMFLYDKDGKPKPFPEVRKKLANALKKLKSFRMWAMLSSPVTWVRNWMGNVGMKSLDGATNFVERAINARLDPGAQQFKYNETRAGKEVYDHIGATHGTYIMSLVRGEDVKYETTAERAANIKREARTVEYEKSANGFRKLCIKAQDITDWGLSTGPLGDEPMVFNGICKNMGNLVASNTEMLLNGIKSEQEKLSKKTTLSETEQNRLNLLNKALQSKHANDIFDALSKEETSRLFAVAKEKTFQQYFKNANVFSKWCANLGAKHPVAAELISWIMPFPKVAINILSMAYRYSPLNFIKGLMQLSTYKQMQSPDYKGPITGFEQADIVRTFSEASVGTVMLIAGAIAAALGWVEIDEDDYMGPSFKIGDIKIGLSNLAPTMTTFSTAASIVWAWKNGKSGVSQALNTLYDNTLLGNIENIFRYGSLEKFGENITISYLSQYIPAVVKLINKATTNSAYKDKSGPYFQKLIRTLGSYMPGVSSLVPDKINPYTGEKAYSTGSDNWFINVIMNLIPLDTKHTGKTMIESEAERVGAETAGLSGSFTINGKDYALSDKSKYAKFRAEHINKQFEDIMSGKIDVTVEDDNGKRITTKYNKLTKEQQARVLKNLYNKATELTKIKYWISEGNYYVTTDKEVYNNYKKLFNSNNIVYKTSWGKSKYITR